jgi:hypothetical protein
MAKIRIKGEDKRLQRPITHIQWEPVVLYACGRGVASGGMRGECWSAVLMPEH